MNPRFRAVGAGMAVALAVILLVAVSPRRSLSDTALDAQLKQLRNEDLDSEYEVMHSLAEMADPAVTDALIAMLKDSNPRVRARAAEVLGMRRDQRAFEPLLAAFDDDDPTVCNKAAEALSPFRDPRAIPALVAHLADDQPRSTWNEGGPIVEALGAIGAPAVEPVLGVLKSDDVKVRISAVWAIKAILRHGPHPRVVEPLLAMLQDPSVKVSEAAATALGETKDPRAVEPLIAILADKGSEIGAAAASALGEIGDPRAVKPLIASLKRQNDLIRGSAAEALAKLRDPSAGDALFAIRREGEEYTRQQIRVTLAKLRDPRAVTAILETTDFQLGSMDQGALSAMGPAAIGPLVKAYPGIKKERVRVQVMEILADSGDPQVMNTLIAGMKDPNEYVRFHAQSGLERMQAPAAHNALILLLNDKDPKVRDGAITALMKSGDPRVPKALVGILAQNPTKLSESAISMLVITDSSQVVSAAVKLLKRPNVPTRKFALRVLSMMGDSSGAGPAIAALKDPDFGVRMIAADTLGALGDKKAAKPIALLLKDKKPDVRSSAASSLGMLKDPSTKAALVAAIKDPNPYVRANVIGALGAFKDPALIKPLVAALHEDDSDRRAADELEFMVTREGTRDQPPQVRENAAEALGSIGPPAVDTLIAETKSQDQVTGQLALSALGKTGDPRVVAFLVSALKDKSNPVPTTDSEEDEAWDRQLAEIKDPNQRKAMEEMRKEMLEQYRKESEKYIGYIPRQALKELNGPGIEDELVKYLQDSDSLVRTTIVEILAQRNDPRAIEPLVAMCDSPSMDERKSGAELLAGMTEPHAVEAAIRNLQHKDVTVRVNTFWQLKESNDPRIADGVAALMNDPAVSGLTDRREGLPLGQLVAMKLGSLGDPRSVKVLLQMIREGGTTSLNDSLAVHAAKALLKVKDIADTEPLVEASKDPNMAVRVVATALLVRAGKASVDDLLKLAGTVVDDGLAEGTNAEGAEDNCRIAAMSFEGITDPRAVEFLLKLMKEGGFMGGWAAVGVLGDFKDPRAVQILISHVSNNGRFPELAIQSLGKIGDKRAVWPIICYLASNRDDTERADVAVQALQKITGQSFGKNAGDWARWWRTQK